LHLSSATSQILEELIRALLQTEKGRRNKNVKDSGNSVNRMHEKRPSKLEYFTYLIPKV